MRLSVLSTAGANDVQVRARRWFSSTMWRVHGGIIRLGRYVRGRVVGELSASMRERRSLFPHQRECFSLPSSRLLSPPSLLPSFGPSSAAQTAIWLFRHAIQLQVCRSFHPDLHSFISLQRSISSSRQTSSSARTRRFTLDGAVQPAAPLAAAQLVSPHDDGKVTTTRRLAPCSLAPLSPSPTAYLGPSQPQPKPAAFCSPWR